MLLQKIAFRLAIGITIVGLVAAIYGYYSYRRPLPQTEGAIQLVGLREEVSIYRDEWGVPHIYAANAHDLFFAQGYIHAQDRWWQMEMNRHIGSGSLSAIMGNDEEVQNTDRFIRTLGWNRIAAAHWEASSSDSRRVLQAYARGVNSYVEDRNQGELAVQYTILGLTGRGFEVNPWQPLDTLAWLTAFGWQSSGNFLEEYRNAQRLQAFDAAILPPDLATDLDFSHLNLRLVGDVNPAALAFMPALNPRSSAWVVSGEMTASGLPLLANDIQSNTTIPSEWYEVGLHCIELTPNCPYDVVGFSLAGVPGVIVGHNATIAWGLSTAKVDTQDIHVIDLNPSNPRQYRYNGEWVGMETLTEIIRVNDTDPINLPVYTTRYGVVISSAPQRGQALTLRWSGEQASDIIRAITGLNAAANWTDFRRALQDWGGFPAEFLYADTQGDIGMQLAGWIPNRQDAQILPSAETGWSRLMPFNRLPSQHDPETGWIIAANQSPFSPTQTIQCGEDSRAERIRELLRDTHQHNPDSFATIQADTYNRFAACLMPYIQGIQFEQTEEIDEETYLRWLDYQQWLGSWDFRSEVDSPYPVLFSIFWVELVGQVFDDEETAEVEGGAAEREMIFWLLEQSDHPWWDNAATPDIAEDRDTTLRNAFTIAIETAEDQYGSLRDRWQWGNLHTVTFLSMPLGESSVAAIDELLNRGAMAVGGGEDTLNNTRWNTSRSNRYRVTALSAFRMMIDLSDFEGSRSILSTGQSGHPASNHYDDMIELWRGVGYRDMSWDFGNISESADSTLRLQPAPTVLG